MSRLSEDKFNQISDSSKQDLNQQMQHRLAQDHTNSGYCHDRDIGPESQRSLTNKQEERAGISSTSDFRFLVTGSSRRRLRWIESVRSMTKAFPPTIRPILRK